LLTFIARYADGIVSSQLEAKLQLRADAIGAYYQHRITIFLGYFEQRAEAADSSQNLGAPGPRSKAV
jgi:hypothetical protein